MTTPAPLQTDPLSDPAPVGGAGASTPPRTPRHPLSTNDRGGIFGLLVKVASLGVVNATGLWALPILVGADVWLGVAFLVISLIAIDVVYLTRARWALPAKFLLPGTLFLLVFLVYPIVYTAWISTTNLGTGNILDKEQAIAQVVQSSLVATADGDTFKAQAAQADDGTLALFLTDEASGSFSIGTADGVIELAESELTFDDDRVVAAGGFRLLGLKEANDLGDALTTFDVPTADGVIRLQTATRASLVAYGLRYDEATDTVISTDDGTIYSPAEGYFVSDSGERLTPGWQTFVGFQNFTRVLTSEAIRGPFLQVFVWNWGFTILSVAGQFALGLALALALDHERLRGRRLYRALLLFPWALPTFLTVLVWEGMLNRQFGVVNGLLGAEVPWLTDPWLARLSIIVVNIWTGFPYMFLVATGALQSLPSELEEAAEVDGAGPFQIFRRVKFPLLMIALAPLLISSFAFNFNNFNVVFFLTRGGPPILGAQTPAGNTDILVSYTFRLAFESGRGQDLAFATAISILIFLHIALFSILSFRRTSRLELNE